MQKQTRKDRLAIKVRRDDKYTPTVLLAFVVFSGTFPIYLATFATPRVHLTEARRTSRQSAIHAGNRRIFTLNDGYTYDPLKYIVLIAFKSYLRSRPSPPAHSKTERNPGPQSTSPHSRKATAR